MEALLTKQLNQHIKCYLKEFDSQNYEEEASINYGIGGEQVIFHFTNQNNIDLFGRVYHKSVQLRDFKNKPLLSKETSLQEQIKLLQEQLTETQDKIKQNNEQHNNTIESTYKHNKVKITKEKKKGGNKQFNKERNYEEYFKEGELFLHRLELNETHKDKTQYGAIPLNHDLTNETNIWKCKYTGNGNNLIGISKENKDEEYKSFKQFMEAHIEYYGHEVKMNTQNAWKGSIKVKRNSIKEARGSSKEITILKLSCLSKLEKLEDYIQPRPRINMTK